jgi:hypothetical protein
MGQWDKVTETYRKDAGRSSEYLRRECSRRGFFGFLLQEVRVFWGELKGKHAYRLSELSGLTDEQLSCIRPVINPDYETLVDGKHVMIRNALLCGPATSLFCTDDKATLLAFSMFDGQHTLGQIGLRLALEMGWEERAAFERAKGLFLSWAAQAACRPRDPLPPDH